MDLRFKPTENIKKYLENSKIEKIGIGYSNSEVLKIEKDGKIFFLKTSDTGLLENEYKRLIWLKEKVGSLVPNVILFENKNGIEFLLTEALKGEMICSEYYLNHPDEGMPIIIDAFNTLYNIDINDCPFDVSLDYKLSVVRNNLDKHFIKEEDVNQEILKKYGSLEGIYEFLVNNKFQEDLCFSHGDISLPNVFAKNGKLSGFIDVGDSGIADRYFDIAIMTRTIMRNYGEEYVDKFYDSMGITPDRERIDYYLTMMELYT